MFELLCVVALLGQPQQVEMFDAIKHHQIDVILIPKNGN